MTYGKDIDCADSLHPGRYATGARLVAQAAYRRLITPRGALRGGDDESIYGFALVQIIGRMTGPGAELTLKRQIEAELLKDDRLASVDITISSTTDTTGAVSYLIDVHGTTADGPFDLTLDVSEVGVTLVGLE